MLFNDQMGDDLVAYNNIGDGISIVMTSSIQVNSDHQGLPSPPNSHEYANSRELFHRRSAETKAGEEFLRNSSTTLDATVELFNELFPHLASRLETKSEDSSSSWVDRLANYWNEIGIDNATIQSTLQNLDIDPTACCDDSEHAVRLLFQRFASALTGICLAHPCSTAVFLTAFDELKATRLDASEATELRRQAECELSECQRRIGLLAEEADDRCRHVEATWGQKLADCQNSNSKTLAQLRSELDDERTAWSSEKEGLVLEAQDQAEVAEKWKKKFADEEVDCVYWKQQATQLREEFNKLEDERNQLLQRIGVISNRFRVKKDCDYASDSSEESSGESSSTRSSQNRTTCKLSADLRKQLDAQMSVNDSLVEKVTELEHEIDRLRDFEFKCHSASKVSRDDSGFDLMNSTNKSANGYEILYGKSATGSWTIPSPIERDDFESSEEELPRCQEDKGVQADVHLTTTSCQVDLLEDVYKLNRHNTALESSLNESTMAFNSLRTRYHKQLLRTNQLIDLTNELYAENCRLAAKNHQQQLQFRMNNSNSSPSCSSIGGSSSSAGNIGEFERKSTSSTSKRRSQRDEIYVVVGPHAGVVLT